MVGSIATRRDASSSSTCTSATGMRVDTEITPSVSGSGTPSAAATIGVAMPRMVASSSRSNGSPSTAAARRKPRAPEDSADRRPSALCRVAGKSGTISSGAVVHAPPARVSVPASIIASRVASAWPGLPPETRRSSSATRAAIVAPTAAATSA